MRLHRAIKRFHNDERGFSFVFAAFAITAIMFVSGISVDLARYYMARARLQANVAQAALAGATAFNPSVDSTSRVASVVNTTLLNNAMSNLMTTNAASISFRCSTSVASNTNNVVATRNALTSCSNVNNANIVQVSQTGTVNLAFGRVLRINSLGIRAISEAIPGALPPGAITSGDKPLNIAFVVDTTASMNSSDGNCKDSNGNSLTRIDCVKMGLAYLLNTLAGTDTQVQLLAFPPLLDTANAGNEYCNPTGTPSITANYGDYNVGAGPTSGAYGSTNEIYTIIPKVAAGGTPTATNTNSASFKTANVGNTGWVLNPTSDWYKLLGPYACGGGKSNCSNSCTGLKAIGGVGTYYGDALAWARNNLTLTNDGTRKDVIVLLSDGDATSTAVGDGKTSFTVGSIKNIVSKIALNGVNLADKGIKNASNVVVTPGTNNFPGGTTTNTYVTQSGSKEVDQCKASAQYADQLAQFSPTNNGKTLDKPLIYSFYYNSGTGGCTTDTDTAYQSPCATMKQISSDPSYFYSVDSGCVLTGGNARVVDISVAFGDLIRTAIGAVGNVKPRLVWTGIL